MIALVSIRYFWSLQLLCVWVFFQILLQDKENNNNVQKNSICFISTYVIKHARIDESVL